MVFPPLVLLFMVSVFSLGGEEGEGDGEEGWSLNGKLIFSYVNIFLPVGESMEGGGGGLHYSSSVACTKRWRLSKSLSLPLH